MILKNEGLLMDYFTFEDILIDIIRLVDIIAEG